MLRQGAADFRAAVGCGDRRPVLFLPRLLRPGRRLPVVGLDGLSRPHEGLRPGRRHAWPAAGDRLRRYGQLAYRQVVDTGPQ